LRADSPSSFLDDGPTSNLIRQIFGAVSEFDKAMTVAKLKAARDRVRRAQGKCEGRKAYAEREGGQELVALARQRRGNLNGQPQSLRKIAADLAERGCVTPSGRPYSASAIASMLGEGSPGYRRGDRLEKRLMTGIFWARIRNTALITRTGRLRTAESGSRLPSIKILFCLCIKSGADALANLPNLGKVVPARGCGHFGNETGRA